MSRRIIIAGGRDFDDYERVRQAARGIVQSGDTILSGGARGADSLGEKFAERNRLGLEKHPADWERHGKGAGFLRNHQMSLCADALIAFWDGRSRGTKNMIEQAHKARLETHVFYYGDTNA